jgi:uncharacterized protein (DUF1697 family)
VNTYVALLRGITPTNSKMRNENLRRVCAGLGLGDVATVISSGNILFRSEARAPELESALEAAWPEQLGFESTTIIRSRIELEMLVELRPFGGREHGPDSYLLTTFSKHPLSVPFELPYRPNEHDYEVVGATEREIFTVTDTTSERTPDVMGWAEREFGKEITSRTWLTVARILERMG